MKTLPKTEPRCAAIYAVGKTDYCPRRTQCARHIAFMKWDAKVGLLNYRGIEVWMGRPDCKKFIDESEIQDD